MARKRKANNQDRVTDPANIYVRLRNNGEAEAYDKAKGEALSEKEAEKLLKQKFAFVDKAYFKYDLVTKGDNVTKDARTGIYQKKTDTVRAYDNTQRDNQGRAAIDYEGPAAGLPKSYTGGAFIWAIDEANNLIRFELSSTGLKKWIEFDGTCQADNVEPDFTVSIEENPDFGPKSTLGKYFPVFTFADISPNEAAIFRAENLLSDFFTSKGVGGRTKPDPGAEYLESEAANIPNPDGAEPAETPNFA